MTDETLPAEHCPNASKLWAPYHTWTSIARGFEGAEPLRLDGVLVMRCVYCPASEIVLSAGLAAFLEALEQHLLCEQAGRRLRAKPPIVGLDAARKAAMVKAFESVNSTNQEHAHLHSQGANSDRGPLGLGWGIRRFRRYIDGLQQDKPK